jgi:hypothetical protein
VKSRFFAVYSRCTVVTCKTSVLSATRRGFSGYDRSPDWNTSEFEALQLSFELWNAFVLNAGRRWGRESKRTGVPHAEGRLFRDLNSLRYREPSSPKLIIAALSCHAVTLSAES